MAMRELDDCSVNKDAWYEIGSLIQFNILAVLLQINFLHTYARNITRDDIV